MKVMSYNVSWCKQDKIDWLLGHDDVDVFVIPECGDEEHVSHVDFHKPIRSIKMRCMVLFVTILV